MQTWNIPGTILITCARGIAPFLAGEVEALGFQVVRTRPVGVEIAGRLADTPLLNLHLRTGQRVLFLLAEAAVPSGDALYEAFLGVPWEAYIPADGYVRVASTVHHPTIRDRRYATLKAKDGIVDRIRSRRGRRPDAGNEREGSSVFFYWEGSLCRIFLDTSGESLARRAYRLLPGAAPMQETLAAAVILATGWTGETPFVNPMAGSGTLGIEAALLALRRPPGLLRENFAFMHVLGFDPNGWRALREEAKKGVRRNLPAPIVCSDISPEALRGAERNARTAGVAHLLAFHVCDIAETPVPAGSGVVVVNPEYGERLGKGGQAGIEALYARIGDFLKRQCMGYTGYVFSGNPGALKRIGLRASGRVDLYNGEIPCTLLRYALYSGSRRESPAPSRDP